MGLGWTLLLLLAAAMLEAGGDALVRHGLRASSAIRLAFLLGGAVVLFGYGCLVNTPPWQFGRLIGVYVVFFFLLAQGIAWVAFGERPSIPMLVGGALIVSGGVVVSLSP